MSTPAVVPSPCINVCRMQSANGLCEGCDRTLDEIGNWASMNDTRKREVWQLIAQRRASRPSALPPKADP